MTATEKQNDLYKKILGGISKVYDNLIEYKKRKNSVLVIMKNNKIVKIKPK